MNVRINGRNITIEENIIDRVIGYLDPVRAQRRLKARAHMALVGGYSGASRSKRSLSQWLTGNSDPDSVILPDLPVLRERSRDLVRNSPLATGAINTVVTNAVGQGLKLQARIDRDKLGMTEEQGEKWEEQTEREWQLFSESQECDLGRTMNFNAIQELVFRQTLENGDVFTIMPRLSRGNFPYLLKLQMVESDRVCNQANKPNSDSLSGGVERDQYGAPIRYHILRQHPGNVYSVKQQEWDLVEAFNEKTGLRNVIHNYRVLRPGQSRGVPYLAPVIESLKQLDRYTEAELMAAVVSGMFTVFVESEKGTADFGQFLPSSESGAQSSDQDYKLGNGAIVGLAPGEKVNTANPGRPNQAFDPFILAILRQVGVALEIPYEILIHHFSASYSASRAAMIEAWRFFRNRRAWLAQNFCQIVYENWLAEAVALGRVKAPGFFASYDLRRAYCGTIWIGDAPGQIDPQKEVGAAKERVELGVSTLDEETVNLTGGDFERNYPRIVKERRMMREIGMWAPVTGQPNGTAAPSDTNQNQNEGDDLE